MCAHLINCYKKLYYYTNYKISYYNQPNCNPSKTLLHRTETNNVLNCAEPLRKFIAEILKKAEVAGWRAGQINMQEEQHQRSQQQHPENPLSIHLATRITRDTIWLGLENDVES